MSGHSYDTVTGTVMCMSDSEAINSKSFKRGILASTEWYVLTSTSIKLFDIMYCNVPMG